MSYTLFSTARPVAGDGYINPANGSIGHIHGFATGDELFEYIIVPNAAPVTPGPQPTSLVRGTLSDVDTLIDVNNGLPNMYGWKAAEPALSVEQPVYTAYVALELTDGTEQVLPGGLTFNLTAAQALVDAVVNNGGLARVAIHNED